MSDDEKPIEHSKDYADLAKKKKSPPDDPGAPWFKEDWPFQTRRARCQYKDCVRPVARKHHNAGPYCVAHKGMYKKPQGTRHKKKVIDV